MPKNHVDKQAALRAGQQFAKLLFRIESIPAYRLSLVASLFLQANAERSGSVLLYRGSIAGRSKRLRSSPKRPDVLLGPTRKLFSRYSS